ncbi:hypothetical protein KY290_036232 [Solanum tuberosum]|uniref:Uncharacterized protein n=1 Tax=Solanum tuberosum TaxID=4113 RepID=A0ABQ7TS32_SOLTU|nr:hypothetical protein KY290_036232 [Solanum tuberosum]
MEDGMSDIANFGFSNSGGDQELKEEGQENVGEMSKGDKEGGVINNLISNLMSPRAGEPKNKERNDLFEAYDKEKSSGESNGGGGIINNLISNIFHPTENSVENQEVQIGEMKKTEEESGSVLDNIMSHLPTPLADDAVPATDEASILIHSIVHD